MRVRGSGSFKPAFGNKVYKAPRFYRPMNVNVSRSRGTFYVPVVKKRKYLSKRRLKLRSIKPVFKRAKRNVAASMIQAAFRGKRLRNFLFKK